MENSEQNKTEEATPFKLKRAREKGQVARGMDLGFLSVLVGFAFFFLIFGAGYIQVLAGMMRRMLAVPLDSHSDAYQIFAIMGSVAWPIVTPLLFLAGILIIIVVFFELLQLRGFIFSTQPLKPDFKKLNPAKGLKRIFSLKMLKETFKNVIKLGVYATVAYLFIRFSIDEFSLAMTDGRKLAAAMQVSALRLILIFMGFALFFVIIDQIIVRQEFKKQMRMSRRELTRETKDREGDPRQKSKRKELHKQFSKDNGGIGDVPGADVVITNPQHYAVALIYDAQNMDAPRLLAKGRNHFAQAIKRKAFLHSVTVVENRPLAQALFKQCAIGDEVPQNLFHDVAGIYMTLRRGKPASTETPHAV